MSDEAQRCVVPTHHDPTMSAAGLLVCQWHHDEAVRLLLLLPDLDEALRIALKAVRSAQAPAPEGGRSQEAPAAISSDVTAVRSTLHMRLAGMVATVALERKYMHPRNDIDSFVVFLSKSADWLSRHKLFAPGWYLAIRELAAQAQHAAYQPRPAGNYLGPCPQPLPVIADDGRTHQEPCGAPIRFDQYRYIDDPTYQISCPTCKAEGSLTWWTERIVGRIDAAPDHLTAVPLSMWLSWGLRRNITPSQIRTWKSRGQLAEVGRDERNRPLYDRAAAETHARRAYKLEAAS